MEYGNDIGVYARVLVALNTASYASVRGSASRRRRLRESVLRSCRVVGTLNLHVEWPCEGLPWS